MEVVNRLWTLAREGKGERTRSCPACDKLMVTVPGWPGANAFLLDVCRACQFVWFDPREYEALSSMPRTGSEERKLPLEARLTLLEAEQEHRDERDPTNAIPEETWKQRAGFLGMPVESGVPALHALPWATWSLAAAIGLTSFLAFFSFESVVKTWGLTPAQAWRYVGLTILTSFFLHGGLYHLIGNLYFLIIFGDNVEDYLGRGRYLVLVLLSTVAGDLLHIAVDPYATMPVIGASGGISGVIAFYALQFPQARIGYRLGYSALSWVRMRARTALGLWIFQQLMGVFLQVSGFSNVSSLAHLGGVAVGLGFWLAAKKYQPQARSTPGGQKPHMAPPS